MEVFAPNVVCVPTGFVNAYLVGEPSGPWALIDAGIPGFSRKIRAAAAARFGERSRPSAIFLTHGHFDHAGGAAALADSWGAPIYAHRLELPYLTGRSDYPPPDPTVGGCIAQLSRVMPHGAVDLGLRLRELGGHGETESGETPGLPGWKWLHTPGHSPGHVAFFREADRTLIAGDALATMDMDSYIGMFTQRRTLAWAGAPFISNWEAAARSVERLAELAPSALGCGHGRPLNEPWLAENLSRFAELFTPPKHGRYVRSAAVADERGVDWLPPKPHDVVLTALMATLGIAALGALFSRRRRTR